MGSEPNDFLAHTCLVTGAIACFTCPDPVRSVHVALFSEEFFKGSLTVLIEVDNKFTLMSISPT